MTQSRDHLSMIYHPDCRFFRGDIPCVPNKREGVHCDHCPFYEPVSENILIIKLGAAGDVIRTTPLLHSLKQEHPSARIWWLTFSPELVPVSQVDRILKWSTESLETLKSLSFSKMFNLDKDHYACALASAIKAEQKFGFVLGKFGETEPANSLAQHKFLTGIFDDVSIANQRSYPDEMLELCGYEFTGQRYILDVPSGIEFPELKSNATYVGMNTGAGARWTSRLWAIDNWAALANGILDSGREVLLLGGPDEEERNRTIQQKTGGRATYLGTFPLQEFIALADRCEMIVTGVTMAMHIAIALRKRLVLMNNIFNPYEFGDLYGLGEIVQPDKQCQCFFRGVCINPAYFCLDHLPVEKMLGAVERVFAKEISPVP